ncbi:MAG: FAD-dependent oxidoreductase [Flavobacteriales bacterium]|nr:FAD-dependent oxidoreductase [Flavobacteriales bacterium]
MKREKFFQLSSIIAIGATVAPHLSLKAGIGRLQDVDVVIIGAGLAGLTAAYRLIQIGGITVKVLEANSRVGGRTLNVETESCYPAELGGQWVGPTQTAILDLMDELGIESFPSYLEGESVGDEGLSDSEQITLGGFVAELEEMASSIDPNAPWTHPMAMEYDAMTIGDWMDNNVGFFMNTNVYLMMYFEIAGWLAEADNVSLLYFLFYLKSAGSWEDLAVSAQSMRVNNGSHSISTALADSMSTDVYLNSPVSEIIESGNSVTVVYNGGEISCTKVIICMNPKDAANISVTPELPSSRLALQNNWNLQGGLKSSVSFNTPFWRDNGLNGSASNNDIYICFDNSPSDAACGAIVMFPSESITNLTSLEARENATIAALVVLFGEEANSYVDYVEHNWSEEEFISGCVPAIVPGFFANHGSALKQPVGNIHYAGTETSDVWAGYMDGAVRSGERVAYEILDALSILDLTADTLQLYPNPSSDFFSISLGSRNQALEVHLYDISGKIVLSSSILTNSAISINHLASGVYLAHVTLQNGETFKRRLLKR